MDSGGPYPRTIMLRLDLSLPTIIFPFSFPLIIVLLTFTSHPLRIQLFPNCVVGDVDENDLAAAVGPESQGLTVILKTWEKLLSPAYSEIHATRKFAGGRK